VSESYYDPAFARAASFIAALFFEAFLVKASL
jgi:hypothetical protein